jgi:3-oxoacyl-(acyl-carrier-protein) synthase
MGVFDSWKKEATGVVPGEGAVFLVLEDEHFASLRHARVLARFGRMSIRAHRGTHRRAETLGAVLRECGAATRQFSTWISAVNGDGQIEQDEMMAMEPLRIEAGQRLTPKQYAGDLFAAAAFLQLGMAALAARKARSPVLANCFGYGAGHAAFILEAP